MRSAAAELDFFNYVGDSTLLTHQNVNFLLREALIRKDPRSNTEEGLSAVGLEVDALFRNGIVDTCAISSDESFDVMLRDAILKFIGQEPQTDRASIALCRGGTISVGAGGIRQIQGGTHWTALHLRRDPDGTIRAFHADSTNGAVPAAVTRVLGTIAKTTRANLDKDLQENDTFARAISRLSTLRFTPCQSVPSSQQPDGHSCGDRTVFNLAKLHSIDIPVGAALDLRTATLPQNGVEVGVGQFITARRADLKRQFSAAIDARRSAARTGGRRDSFGTDRSYTKDPKLVQALIESVMIGTDGYVDKLKKIIKIETDLREEGKVELLSTLPIERCYREIISDCVEQLRFAVSLDDKGDPIAISEELEMFLDNLSSPIAAQNPEKIIPLLERIIVEPRLLLDEEAIEAFYEMLGDNELALVVARPIIVGAEDRESAVPGEDTAVKIIKRKKFLEMLGKKRDASARLPTDDRKDRLWFLDDRDIHVDFPYASAMTEEVMEAYAVNNDFAKIAIARPADVNTGDICKPYKKGDKVKGFKVVALIQVAPTAHSIREAALLDAFDVSISQLLADPANKSAQVLIPVNTGDHWTLIEVNITRDKDEFVVNRNYYNSAGEGIVNEELDSLITTRFTGKLREKSPSSTISAPKPVEKTSKRQAADVSCGPVVCWYADRIMADARADFEGRDAEEFPKGAFDLRCEQLSILPDDRAYFAYSAQLKDLHHATKPRAARASNVDALILAQKNLKIKSLQEALNEIEQIYKDAELGVDSINAARDIVNGMAGGEHGLAASDGEVEDANILEAAIGDEKKILEVLLNEWKSKPRSTSDGSVQDFIGFVRDFYIDKASEQIAVDEEKVAQQEIASAILLAGEPDTVAAVEAAARSRAEINERKRKVELRKTYYELAKYSDERFEGAKNIACVVLDDGRKVGIWHDLRIAEEKLEPKSATDATPVLKIVVASDPSECLKKIITVIDAKKRALAAASSAAAISAAAPATAAAAAAVVAPDHIFYGLSRYFPMRGSGMVVAVDANPGSFGITIDLAPTSPSAGGAAAVAVAWRPTIYSVVKFDGTSWNPVEEAGEAQAALVAMDKKVAEMDRRMAELYLKLSASGQVEFSRDEFGKPFISFEADGQKFNMRKYASRDGIMFNFVNDDGQPLIEVDGVAAKLDKAEKAAETLFSLLSASDAQEKQIARAAKRLFVQGTRYPGRDGKNIYLLEEESAYGIMEDPGNEDEPPVIVKIAEGDAAVLVPATEVEGALQYLTVRLEKQESEIESFFSENRSYFIEDQDDAVDADEDVDRYYVKTADGTLLAIVMDNEDQSSYFVQEKGPADGEWKYSDNPAARLKEMLTCITAVKERAAAVYETMSRVGYYRDIKCGDQTFRVLQDYQGAYHVNRLLSAEELREEEERVAVQNAVMSATATAAAYAVSVARDSEPVSDIYAALDSIEEQLARDEAAIAVNAPRFRRIYEGLKSISASVENVGGSGDVVYIQVPKIDGTPEERIWVGIKSTGGDAPTFSLVHYADGAERWPRFTEANAAAYLDNIEQLIKDNKALNQVYESLGIWGESALMPGAFFVPVSIDKVGGAVAADGSIEKETVSVGICRKEGTPPSFSVVRWTPQAGATPGKWEEVTVDADAKKFLTAIDEKLTATQARAAKISRDLETNFSTDVVSYVSDGAEYSFRFIDNIADDGTRQVFGIRTKPSILVVKGVADATKNGGFDWFHAKPANVAMTYLEEKIALKALPDSPEAQQIKLKQAFDNLLGRRNVNKDVSVVFVDHEGSSIGIRFLKDSGTYAFVKRADTNPDTPFTDVVDPTEIAAGLETIETQVEEAKARIAVLYKRLGDVGVTQGNLMTVASGDRKVGIRKLDSGKLEVGILREDGVFSFFLSTDAGLKLIEDAIAREVGYDEAAIARVVKTDTTEFADLFVKMVTENRDALIDSKLVRSSIDGRLAASIMFTLGGVQYSIDVIKNAAEGVAGYVLQAKDDVPRLYFKEGRDWKSLPADRVEVVAKALNVALKNIGRFGYDAEIAAIESAAAAKASAGSSSPASIPPSVTPALVSAGAVSVGAPSLPTTPPPPSYTKAPSAAAPSLAVSTKAAAVASAKAPKVRKKPVAAAVAAAPLAKSPLAEELEKIATVESKAAYAATHKLDILHGPNPEVRAISNLTAEQTEHRKNIMKFYFDETKDMAAIRKKEATTGIPPTTVKAISAVNALELLGKKDRTR